MSCKVHPQIIVSGWRKAVQVAQQALEAAAVDHSSDEEKFKEDLLNIARTTLSSKILMQHRDHFANLAVEAVLRLKVKSARIFYVEFRIIILQEHNVRSFLLTNFPCSGQWQLRCNSDHQETWWKPC